MMQFTSIGVSEYETKRFSLIKEAEGAKTYLYFDSVGIPTTGIGFNLAN